MVRLVPSISSHGFGFCNEGCGREPQPARPPRVCVRRRFDGAFRDQKHVVATCCGCRRRPPVHLRGSGGGFGAVLSTPCAPVRSSARTHPVLPLAPHAPQPRVWFDEKSSSFSSPPSLFFFSSSFSSSRRCHMSHKKKIHRVYSKPRGVSPPEGGGGAPHT